MNESKEEIIGLFIDIFEDDLHNRDLERFSSDPKPKVGTIKLHFEDKDSDGVFYGGPAYDKVAGQIKTLLKELGYFKE